MHTLPDFWLMFVSFLEDVPDLALQAVGHILLSMFFVCTTMFNPPFGMIAFEGLFIQACVCGLLVVSLFRDMYLIARKKLPIPVRDFIPGDDLIISKDQF